LAQINQLQQPAAQQPAQVVIDPNMANLISGAILATMAGLQQTNNMGLGYPTQGGLNLRIKSIKYLMEQTNFQYLHGVGYPYKTKYLKCSAYLTATKTY